MFFGFCDIVSSRGLAHYIYRQSLGGPGLPRLREKLAKSFPVGLDKGLDDWKFRYLTS
jgi:hypothetical protein